MNKRPFFFTALDALRAAAEVYMCICLICPWCLQAFLCSIMHQI